MHTNMHITVEPAAYSWIRKACNFKITKAGLKALAKVETERFIGTTDWHNTCPVPGWRGRYATIREVTEHMGPVSFEVRSYTGNPIVFETDGKTIQFR